MKPKYMFKKSNALSAQKLTNIGLFIAFSSIPLLLAFFNLFSPPGMYTNSFIICREISAFTICGFFVIYITKVEKQSLNSIGLHGNHWGKSLLLSFIILVISFLVAACLLYLLKILNITYGNSTDASKYNNLSPFTMTLVVLRAGVAEEICYRGYAMERIAKINKNWQAYFLFPLLLFSLMHYRQGIVGIIISFPLGFVLAFAYWKKRDLKANIIAHFLADFIPNVLFQLL
jgi:membrane protease YdiL (CAAX protease family)